MKITTWDKALMEYIEEQRDKPFEWITHDCVTFVRGACEAQLGEDIFEKVIPQYKTLKGGKGVYARLGKKNQNYQTVLNSVLKPCELLLPPRGSVIAKHTDNGMSAVFGAALGVVVSRFAAFVGDDGLEFLPVHKNDEAWLVE
jgi:hypothetical protein